MIDRIRSSAAVCALLASSALSAPALAQTAPAPRFVNVDGNGVDLTTGEVSFAFEEGGIGSGEGAVRMQRIWAQDAGWVDNWSGGMFTSAASGTTKTYVQIAGISDVFTLSGGTYTSENAQGSTLVYNSGQGVYDYTAADGTKIQFIAASYWNISRNCPGANPQSCHIPLQLVRPNGLKYNFWWDSADLCRDLPGEPCGTYKTYVRLLGVSSSAGYGSSISYVTNFIGTWPVVNPAWFNRSSVSFTNSTGNPSPVPNITYAYPASGVEQVTDPAGRVWRLTTTSGEITGIRRPGSGSDNVTYAYGTGGVTSATKDGVTTSYSRIVAGSTATTTVTNALSQQSTVVSDLTKGRPTSFQDALSRTTSFLYDANSRPTRTTQPEGNYVELTYDARGNVTQSKAVAKSGSGLADIIASATYDATCTNPVKCNKPNTATDPRGHVTDFAYDATHGGVTSVTRPAPTGGAVRPQTRVTYTAVTSASGQLVTLPTKVSACQTLASCDNAADESKTTAGYNSNLLPTTVSSGNGTGTLTATSAMTYDPRGNMLTADGPLAGSADTTRFVYDAIDRTIGTISPDPDGAGSLKNRAIKTTFRPDSQIDKVERGTTIGQTDAAFAAFVSLETQQLAYDANNRPVTQSLVAGATTYALTQLSYDAVGRAECSAVRMNPAIYGSLPASACTLGTQGTNGPDRISKSVFDAAGQVTQQIVAFGTADQAAEASATYSNNAKLATLTDAENNKTTYEYDGHDRLSKTRMPLPAKGANASSTTDYELLAYDAASNVTSRRLRDAQSIAFTYDNLNRATLKNLSGSEPDVTYAYDNLNRLTAASQTGNALSFTYDALSRNLTQVGPQGTSTSIYDLAGRRTKLTFPGAGLFVDQEYLVTGETTKLKENGASSGVGVLATYTYDDLGRRTGVTFGNGASQAFGYDPVSRLASLTNNLTGTTNDLSVTFAYNPASQIASTVRTGDTYSWTGHGSGTTASVANGLNQLTSIGGSATTHDTKGNLTTDPTTGKTYAYSSENLLTSASGGVTLGYDPMLRLYQLAGAATTRFAYDGLDPIAEYNSSNVLQRRFVHGPGVDEPIVWYEGSGTTDRRFLGADERGSIISVSDSAGAMLNLNRYDEYGKPQATNAGRFQYTGQMWLGEPGVYYYKARMYLPTLGGRFLQTDPIGYDDSMNLYAYARNDPVNMVDPLGLETIVVTATRYGALPNMGWTPYFNPGLSIGPSPNIGVTIPAIAALLEKLKPKPEPQKDPNEIVVTGVRVSRDQLLVGAANEAANSIPPFFHSLLGRTAFGWLRGILIHNKFAAIIRAKNSPLYNAEVSYLRGKIVPYGTPGSSRVDAVVGNVASPLFAIDLKTGTPFISSSQLNAYRANLPPGALLQILFVP